jgi:hypothetical protein
MMFDAEEEMQIEEVKKLLADAGIVVDEKRYMLKRGRERVYCSSLVNMKRLMLMLYDVLEKKQLQEV